MTTAAEIKRDLPKPNQVYRHFKGDLYKILDIAEHTENHERLVVYKALHGTKSIYARPVSMFMSPVNTKKYPEVKQFFRFELVEGRQ